MNADLGRVLVAAVITASVSVLVMESFKATSWLADELIRWSVRVRYAADPKRAAVRREELLSLREDLPSLFKLPTAVVFLLCALAYRLANFRSHTTREPQAGDLVYRAECTDGWLGESRLDYKDAEFDLGKHLGNYHGGEAVLDPNRTDVGPTWHTEHRPAERVTSEWGPAHKRLADGNEMAIHTGFRPVRWRRLRRWLG